MRTLLFSSLVLATAACNGAYPSATASGGSSGAAGASGNSGTGASTGSSSGGEGSSSASASGGSATGSSTGFGTASAAASSTGLATGKGSSSGTGTGSGTGSGTGTGTGTGTGGTTSGGSADAGCDPACAGKLSCCAGTCVDLNGDTFNCGSCGNLCPVGDYCSGGSCVAATCPTDGCTNDNCCGGQCCAGTEVCCLDNGLVEAFLCEPANSGSCPVGCQPNCVSRRDAKRDIQYLDEPQLQSAEDQVLRIPLARFNYKWDAPSERRRLGFIIEDVAPNPGVIDEARGEVDLYGYTSLAVAALQEQAKEIAQLRQKVSQLEKRLDGPPPSKRKHPPPR